MIAGEETNATVIATRLVDAVSAMDSLEAAAVAELAEVYANLSNSQRLALVDLACALVAPPSAVGH